MSVQTEVTRLSSSKSAIKTSLANKGVTVPISERLDAYSTYIDSLPTIRTTTTAPTTSEGKNGDIWLVLG